MKYNIRTSIFETNSSSVHSITMCMKDDYIKWCNGELLMKDGQFLEKEQAKLENADDLKKYENVSEEEIERYLKDEISLSDLVDICCFSDYWHSTEEDSSIIQDRGFEEFEESFITPNGESVIAFGYFGNDY